MWSQIFLALFDYSSWLNFVHSGNIAQRFYEVGNYRVRAFSDVGLSRRYAENV